MCWLIKGRHGVTKWDFVLKKGVFGPKDLCLILRLAGVQECVFGSVRRRVSWGRVPIGEKP